MLVQLRHRARTAFIAHPLAWVLLGVPLLIAWSGTIVAIRWNAIEMMIGRNLLAGRGPIVAVLDPPALWRPPLGWLLCAAAEVAVRDPFRIYQILYTISVTTCAVTAFYVARKAWGLVAAHAACLFILTSSGVTSLLVYHSHGLSHIVLLLAMGPAIGATVVALSRPDRLWMSLAGGAWALACLARPESLVAFLVSGCFLLHGSWRMGRIINVLYLGAAFLLVTGPYVLYSQQVRARYGIVGPSALTTFYASEAFVTGDFDEEAGFVRAIARYGTIEQHDNSLSSLLWQRPEAGFERLRINVPRLRALYTSGAFFPVAWFVALPFALLDALWLKRQRGLYLYCLSLLAGSFALCLFHVDPRYATLGVPPLMLILCGGISALWELARRTGRRWALALASVGLVAGGAVIGGSSVGALTTRLSAGQYGQARHAIRASETLAEDFRARRSGSPDVLVVIPEAGSTMVYEYPTFLASYFAGTALPWSWQGVYPRDTIFSMVSKPADYVYLPESMLHGTDLLLRRTALSAVPVSARETYHLFPVGAAPSPLAQLDEKTLDSLGAILRRDYPRLLDEFEAERSWTKARVDLRYRSRSADRVGCAPPALAPDRRTDIAFLVELSGIPTTSSGEFIESMSLERQAPHRLWQTGDVAHVLGVTPRGEGRLLNRPDGSVKIAVEPDLKVRVLACDDGEGTISSTYQVRLQIGSSRSLVSPPVTLNEN